MGRFIQLGNDYFHIGGFVNVAFPLSAASMGSPDGKAAPDMPAGLTLLLAVASGVVAANVYYAQPLIGPISVALGLSPQHVGLIVSMTQIGYGAGLLLLVPLGDLIENRWLVVMLVGVATLALAGAAVVTQPSAFLACALLTGVGSVAVQLLVPYAAHLAPDAVRGRIVGLVTSGLMLGIMLARPAASFVTQALSWRAVFVIAALLMVGLGGVLRMALPQRRPAPGLRYGQLLRSMVRLARHTPVLQRRALCHAGLFSSCSLFWTAVPLVLADTFRLSQNGIALFALAGVAGAIAAPLAGRAADRGWSRPATQLAMTAVIAALPLGWLGASMPHGGLAILVGAAILLDIGVTAHFVLGQRAIFTLDAAARSRLNGLYMATFFAGGAIGSAAGGWVYAHGGWPWAMAIGLCLPVVALASTFAERSPPTPRRASHRLDTRHPATFHFSTKDASHDDDT
jgi:predicted MFS family arabinose efflux permease